MSRPGNIQNINDPIRDGYGYRPYTSPVAQADGPAKRLDLNKLSFSVDDFQKLSSGKYNAGHIVLDKKGRLDIANNHVTLTSLNTVSVNAADSLAIRIAFADALERAGVSDERMEAVRERLGLGADSSFGKGVSLTPLSRQEVRQIIDENIGEINEGRVARDRLQTEAQLQARLGDQTKADRAETRQRVTGAAENANGLSLDTDMAYVTDFVNRTDFSKFSSADLDDMLEFGDELKQALAELCDDDANANWRHENGGALRFERVSGAVALALDPDDGGVLVKVDTQGRTLTFALGMGADDFAARIDRGESRIVREVAKRKAAQPTPLKDIAKGSAAGAFAPLFDAFKANVRRADRNADPAKALQGKMVATVKAELATNIAQQIGEEFNPDSENTVFKTDIPRGLHITLGGKKMPNEFKAARETMLRFVTGDETLTWANATREQKVRTNIVLALCNQSLNATYNAALSDALNARPDSNMPAVSFAENGQKGFGRSHGCAYAVTKNAAGDITIRLREAKFVNTVCRTLPNGEMDDVALDGGSHVDFDLSVTIPKANLDKLASADWEHYNHAPVREASEGVNNTPNGRLNAARLVPDAFKLQPKVRLKVSAHLDAPGQPTEDPNPPNIDNGRLVDPEEARIEEMEARAAERAARFVPKPPAEGPRPVPPAPPLNVPPSVPDIPVKAKAPKVEPPKVDEEPKVEAQPKVAAEEVNNVAGVAIPKITNNAEFKAFMMSLGLDTQTGVVTEDEMKPDPMGDMKKTFVFNGIAFRGDGRSPEEVLNAGGLKSKNDLSIPRNLTEAMGLGVPGEDPKTHEPMTVATGATGTSGVSCGRTVNGAIGYLQPGGTFFVIDTTKLPQGEKAWDMESTVYGNGEERTLTKEGKPFDKTGAEVNVSDIPNSAIIGWVRTTHNSPIGTTKDNAKRLDFMQKVDFGFSFEANPEYQA